MPQPGRTNDESLPHPLRSVSPYIPFHFIPHHHFQLYLHISSFSSLTSPGLFNELTMWWIVYLVLSALLYILFSTIGVGLIVPFVGIVVRFRVNYNPKGFALGSRYGDAIGLAPDGTEEARVVGPRVTSLFSMLLRVRRLEGWRGLWKGFSEYLR